MRINLPKSGTFVLGITEKGSTYLVEQGIID